MAVKSPPARREYPVGIPVQPPPGWRPPVPPIPPRPADSTFRAQVSLILRAMLLSLLVIVCMGIGWFLVQGRRPRVGEQVASVTPPVAKKSDKSDPLPPPA